jgi:hypothetical protein
LLQFPDGEERQDRGKLNGKAKIKEEEKVYFPNKVYIYQQQKKK